MTKEDLVASCSLSISPGAEVQQNWMSLKTADPKMTSFGMGKGRRQNPEAHTCMQRPAVKGQQQLHTHPETSCPQSSSRHASDLPYA